MRKKGVLQLISTAFVLFSSTSYAQHVNSDKPLNCDSTCIIPDSRTTPLPKAQTARTPTIISQGPSRAQCGSAHQSVLPGPPSSFLCAPGMASNVATINDDGDITYRWTCGTALGTQTCQAKQRVTGACGLDHGRTLSSNPSNLCATGQSYGFNFTGNQYTWGCAGNYGSPAYCSATYQPPEPIWEVPISENVWVEGWTEPTLWNYPLTGGELAPVKNDATRSLWYSSSYEGGVKSGWIVECKPGFTPKAVELYLNPIYPNSPFPLFHKCYKN